MRTMNRVLGALAVLVILGACQAETFTEIEASRSPLITGFDSYASRKEIIPRLSTRFTIQVREDSSLSPGDPRPPFSIANFNVVDFRHLDTPGELHIAFFNDRLEETRFYPNDVDSYLLLLKRSGLSPAEFREEIVAGNTVVRSGVDYRGKRFVAWSDERLRAQRFRWINKYA